MLQNKTQGANRGRLHRMVKHEWTHSLHLSGNKSRANEKLVRHSPELQLQLLRVAAWSETPKRLLNRALPKLPDVHALQSKVRGQATRRE